MMADKVFVKMNPDRLSVVQLQEELRNRGLKVSGLKAELIERLKDALQKEQHLPPETEASPPKKSKMEDEAKGSEELPAKMEIPLRSVRFGSLTTVPVKPVSICEDSIGISVRVGDVQHNITLMPNRDLHSVQAHIGERNSAIFIQVTAPCGIQLRRALQLTPGSGPFFDPHSTNQSHKLLMLMPDPGSRQTWNDLSKIFLSMQRKASHKNKDFYQDMSDVEVRTILRASDVRPEDDSDDDVPDLETSDDDSDDDSDADSDASESWMFEEAGQMNDGGQDADSDAPQSWMFEEAGFTPPMKKKPRNMNDGGQDSKDVKSDKVECRIENCSRSDDISEKLRKQGNDVFRTFDGARPLEEQQSTLVKALSNYQKALEVAQVHETKASAAKNVATMSWKLANIAEISQSVGKKQKDYLVKHYFEDALKHFGIAHANAVHKDKKWVDDIRKSANSCLDEICSIGLQYSYEERITLFEDLLACVKSDRLVSGHVALDLATYMKSLGITQLNAGDYKSCLNWMVKAYCPLELAKSFPWRLGDHKYEQVQRELESEVFAHRCIAESMQARLTGDELLKQGVVESEDLNMDLVHSAMDKYKEAKVLSANHGRGTEMLARAHYCLGHVYSKVLKNKDKAKKNFLETVRLVHLLESRPKVITQDWYKECADTLQQYQFDLMTAEEVAYHRGREEVMKELEPEIKELNKVEMNRWKLLEFIYEKYPPKNPAHRPVKPIDDLEWCDLKKALQKAIVHYHPDKVDLKEHGAKWKAMSEEITKRLTRLYESHKG